MEEQLTGTLIRNQQAPKYFHYCRPIDIEVNGFAHVGNT